MRLACENLTVAFKRNPVLHHVTYDFIIGDLTAIVGPNGAGKTTLLKAILGLVDIDSGRIVKENLTQADIAYLPQLSDIEPMLPFTVEDFLFLGCWSRIGYVKKPNVYDEQLIDKCLFDVGLSGFRKRIIHELSKGQLQRVLIARVLMQNAKIIILDEPFSAMDEQTILKLLQIISKWKQEKKTVIAVLHDLNHVKDYFTYSILIAKQIIASGLTSNVINEHNLNIAYSSSFVLQEHNDLCEI